MNSGVAESRIMILEMPKQACQVSETRNPDSKLEPTEDSQTILLLRGLVARVSSNDQSNLALFHLVSVVHWLVAWQSPHWSGSGLALAGMWLNALPSGILCAHNPLISLRGRRYSFGKDQRVPMGSSCFQSASLHAFYSAHVSALLQ